MIFIVGLGAIFVLIGNNTKTKYSKAILISGLVVTPIGIILMLIFH
jgi:hypothetical protein